METQAHPRKAYPTDVGDEEWQFVASSLALVREDAPQRRYALREVCNGFARDRAHRRALALAAGRLPTLGGGLPADPTLAGGRGLRGHDP